MRGWLGLSVLWAGVAWGGIPELEQGVYIQAGTKPLTVKPYTAPSVIDWNNDGKKDLLVGQFDEGNIWLYLNRGTDSEPVFTSGVKVLSQGQPITTSYG